MKRALMLAAAVAILAAAAAAWRGDIPGRELLLARAGGAGALRNATSDDGPAAYYQHPDGEPLYSLTPKQTEDGRPFRAVAIHADINFEGAGTPAPAAPPAKGERQLKYYRNPMGLPDTSPVPKKDSMGMDYTPVYEGDDQDDGSIKLSPGRIQRTGVRAEPATRRVVQPEVKAPGTIQLDERRVSVIAMRSETFVQKVPDVTTGARVRQGQALMEVYSPAIISAAAEFLATINSKITAGTDQYPRGSRQRLVNLDVPESAIAAIEKSRTVPVTFQWTSPRDGVVLERNAVEGMRAQPGEVLFRIADLSVLWALIDVAERDLGALAPGQEVTIRARAFPGRTFMGKIGVIYPQVNRETRTARLRVELDNAGLELKPDMYVDAAIETGSAEPVLAVSATAVLDSGNRQTVLIDKGEGRFEPREVKLGRRDASFIEVREGLQAGEQVVVAATFLIDAESNLKAALRSFDAGAGK